MRIHLEAQLRAHRALTAPINHVPTDVLFLIFHEVIRDRPRAGGLLLQVCKSWNLFVTDQPGLWSRIMCKSCKSIEEFERSTEYVRASLRYSRNVPLDIDLNFNGIRASSFWHHIVGKCVDDDDYERILGRGLPMAVMSWVDRTEELEELKDFPLMKLFSEAFERHLETITGQNGEIMARWRSLKITPVAFFRRCIGDDIFSVLWNSLPLLRHLVIERFRLEDEHPPALLPFTPSLTSIVWDGGYEILDLVPGSSQVTEFSLLGLLPRHDLSYTLALKNLQILYLEFVPVDGDESHLYLQPLQYPHLKTLTLRGRIPANVVNAIEAPCLQKLFIPQEINPEMVFRLLSRLPTVSALSVSIHLPDIGAFSAQVHAQRKNLHSITLVELELFDGEDLVVSDALGETRRNGFPLAQSFLLIDEDAEDYDRDHRLCPWASPT